MACWAFKAPLDLTDAYEELSAKNNDMMGVVKRLEQDREALRLQCEGKQLEVQELSRKLRDAAVLESRLQVALERSAAEEAELKRQAAAATKQLDEAVREGRSYRQDNELLLTRVDRLGKERTYLQARVDRMQRALSMLEDVLDSTLTETSQQPSAARMDELRQSKHRLMELREGPQPLEGSFEPRTNPMYESRVKLAPAEVAWPRSGPAAMRYSFPRASPRSPRSPAGSPRKPTPRSGPLPAARDSEDVQVELKDQKA
jgi:hypothetical protein